MNIGENIKYFRKANNMLQQDLADKLKVTKGAVSSWEVGRTEPNIGMIEAMCSIFQCQKSDLLDLDIKDGWHDYTPPEGTPTYKVAWPPNQVILSDHEEKVITAYRNAPDGIQEAVDKLLDIDSEKKKAFSGA